MACLDGSSEDQENSHGICRGGSHTVFVEEVARQQDHIHLAFLCKSHDFIEAAPTVVLPDRVSLPEAHMIICGHEDADSVIV